MSLISQVEWYVAKPGTHSQLKGPMSESELGEKLRSGEISWTDSAWSAQLGPSWRRILEIPLFRQFYPDLASAALLPEIAAKAQPAKTSGAESENWYLNYEGSEFGPLSAALVCQILGRGKLKGNVLAWAEGMDKWVPLFDVPVFKEYFLTGKLPVSRLEKRRFRRRPIVGTVSFTRVHDDGKLSQNTYTGICKDISVSGIRVNSSSVPNSTGMKFQLLFEPLDTTAIPSFKVEGEVARIHDGESFAVRFLDLKPEFAERIQAFVTEWYATPPKIELETKK